MNKKLNNVKTFEQHTNENSNIPDAKESYLTISKCPHCGKPHKFLASDTKLEKYTRIFICPETQEMFQASITVK